MEDLQTSITEWEGGSLVNEDGIGSPEIQVTDGPTSCNITTLAREQTIVQTEGSSVRICVVKLPVAADLSVTEDSERGLEDSLSLHPLSETRGLEQEDNEENPDGREQQGRSIHQQPIEESSIKFEIGQLANEYRKLTDRQDSLLSLLGRSLQVHSPINPASETNLSGHLMPEDLAWTYNVAQRYWASLMLTDGDMSNTAGLFLGNMVGGNHWLKRASRAHTSASPKVEVIHESGKGDATIRTTYTFEWEPCVIESELESWYCPSATERDADTEAVLAGVRQYWPTALSEEFHEWLSTNIGGSMCAVPPMMPQVSMLASQT